MVWAGCVAGGVGRGEGSRGTRYLHIYIHIIIIYIITYINKVLIAFTTWDTDGDGYLSWEEFHQISNNSSMSEEQAVRIFQHCDKVSQRQALCQSEVLCQSEALCQSTTPNNIFKC